MRTAQIGTAQVSRLTVGGNPFSGFSHQSPARDQEMRDYFTPRGIKDFLHQAAALGVNTVFARADDHIMGVLREYWDEGGTLQWFAQVCADVRGESNESDTWKEWMDDAAKVGATALYLHGGLVDYWQAQGYDERFHEALARMRDHGRVAGFAGHRPVAHAWIRDHLDPDFQMCCYYNPTDRAESPHHQGEGEKWDFEDRTMMLEVVATIPRPVVHFKIFAGGNMPIVEAFETLGRAMREDDVVCLGIFPGDDPELLAKDIGLFDEHVETAVRA